VIGRAVEDFGSFGMLLERILDFFYVEFSFEFS